MTSQNHNYPTRMHEVLGVEVDEEATYKSTTKELKDFRFFVDEYGSPRYPSRLLLDGYDMANIINHPECIIRKPRLSEEQVRQLKALATLGFYWLVKRDEGGYAYATENKPHEKRELWAWFGSCFRLEKDGNQGVLYSLVSWSDPEPLDIVATLKAAGVEIEEENK